MQLNIVVKLSIGVLRGRSRIKTRTRLDHIRCGDVFLEEQSFSSPFCGL